MKKLLIWAALIAAVTTAASLAVARFTPASQALQLLLIPGPLSSGHAYLADRCDACHVTNTGVTAAKCTVCHANDERLLGRQPTAFHASIGECANCHFEHQGRNTRPVAMDHLELARVGARTLTQASPRDAASAATLKSMETWLNIRIPRQLDERSAREVLNCWGAIPPKTAIWDCSARTADSVTQPPVGQSRGISILRPALWNAHSVTKPRQVTT